MSEREIRVREVVRDIRSGMGHVDLMVKYKLTPVGLQRLFDELTNLGLLAAEDRPEVIPGRQKIKIKDVVKDVTAGLTDAQLMEKYQLSRDALQFLFKKLLDLKAIDRDTLFGEVNLEFDTSIPEHVRELHRYVLDFEIPVYELGTASVQGRLHDITEKGVGTRGLACPVQEVVTLVVLGDAFGVIEPFEFDAVCRWSKTDKRDGEQSAGFQILAISDPALGELRKVIKLTNFEQ